MSAESMTRKLFLKLTLTSTATTLMGCSGDEGEANTDGNTVSGTNTNNTATSTATNSMTSTSTNTSSSANSASSGGTNTATSSMSSSGPTSTSTGGTTASDAGTNSSTTDGVGGGGTSGTSTGASGMGGASSGGGAGGSMSTSGGSVSCAPNVTMTSNEMHDHLPLTGMESMELVMMVTSQSGLSWTWYGGDQHSHTIEFTAEEIMTLANGGTVTGKECTSAPRPSPHTHVYDISCA